MFQFVSLSTFSCELTKLWLTCEIYDKPNLTFNSYEDQFEIHWKNLFIHGIRG